LNGEALDLIHPEIRPMLRYVPVLLAVCVATPLPVGADDGDTPPPTPLTRPDMKQMLEDVKARKPRIPLPELTDADREKLGDSATSYESRLRYHYLPTGEGRGGGGGGGRDSDPNMTLDYRFKVELFWIVSRANNCLY
jgi:hypothetical protein